MRKSVFTLVTVLSVFFLITSCQKELSFEGIKIPSKSDSLRGNWEFVSMDVKSALTAVQLPLSNIYKREIILDFISKSNAGSLNIDSFYLSMTDFSYLIDTTSTYTESFNDLGLDTLIEDVTYDAPPFTASSEYKVVGADSLYLPNADFINLPIDLVLVPPVTGFKFRFEGDKLILTTSITISQVDNTLSPPVTLTSAANIVITFRKQ